MHKLSPFAFLKSHFAPAFFLLSADRRRALQQIYSVFRLLDDVADTEQLDVARQKIKAWRLYFETWNPHVLQDVGYAKLGSTLLSVIKTYDIPKFAFVDFIDKGLWVDLSQNRFETPMDTESYCYGVAGVVGVACLPIFGVPWNEGKDYAIRLGTGIQWINIIRDVAVDARMGRIYLPMDHLQKFGCDESEILSGQNSPAFQELMKYEADVARSHFRRAQELLPIAYRDVLRPARTMGEIYMKLLAKIEKHHYAVLEKKIRLNFLEKVTTVWSVLRS